MSELIDGRYWRLARWFKDLAPGQLDQLLIYHAELIKFNGRINLISPRTEKIADQVHFADSIMGGRLVLAETKASKIYDLGSGNGLPGLIMAVLEPRRKFVLVDADARKVEFLKHCVTRLNLKNVEFINGRLEDLEHDSIECAVSRGLASISKALIMSRRATATGCEFYHFKGDSWSKELAEIPSQVLAHWELKDTRSYTLPESTITLSIVLTRKL